MLDDFLRQIARAHARLAGQRQRDVTGKVTVAFAARALELNGLKQFRFQSGARLHGGDRLSQKLTQTLSHLIGRFRRSRT